MIILANVWPSKTLLNIKNCYNGQKPISQKRLESSKNGFEVRVATFYFSAVFPESEFCKI